MEHSTKKWRHNLLLRIMISAKLNEHYLRTIPHKFQLLWWEKKFWKTFFYIFPCNILNFSPSDTPTNDHDSNKLETALPEDARALHKMQFLWSLLFIWKIILYLYILLGNPIYYPILHVPLWIWITVDTSTQVQHFLN